MVLLFKTDDSLDEHLTQVQNSVEKDEPPKLNTESSFGLKPPDPALVTKARQGDKTAFAQLVESYWTLIYCYLLRLVGQAELAADLTQETFFKGFQSISEIPANRELEFRPWLYRIATNLAISELRHTKKYRWLSLNWLSDRISQQQSNSHQNQGSVSSQIQKQLADKHPGPVEQILATEYNHKLVVIFTQLPHEQAVLLLLRFYHELSYEEISQVLGGLRLDTVRARLHRARLAFCRLYELFDLESQKKISQK